MGSRSHCIRKKRKGSVHEHPHYRWLLDCVKSSGAFGNRARATAAEHCRNPKRCRARSNPLSSGPMSRLNRRARPEFFRIAVAFQTTFRETSQLLRRVQKTPASLSCSPPKAAPAGRRPNPFWVGRIPRCSRMDGGISPPNPPVPCVFHASPDSNAAQLRHSCTRRPLARD